MAPRRSAQSWRQTKQIMLGTAIVLIAIAAISAGGSAEAWIKITVAVVAGFGVVLLIFRPGRWHAEPSHQASPPAV